MQSNSITKPMISVEVLGKMMRKLSAEQLKKLPVEKLPDNIPDVVYEIGSAEKGEVLEDLLFRRDSDRMTRHCDDLEKYGRDLADALESAESGRVPPVIKEFLQGVKALSTLRQDAAKNADAAAEIDDKCTELQRLLREVTESSLLKAERMLVEHADTLNEANERKRFDKAVARLHKKVKPVVKALTVYNRERIRLAHREMSALRKRIKDESANQEILEAELDALHEELSRSRSMWGRALGKYHNSPAYTELQDQIKSVLAKKRMTEVIIDDDELLRWLDSIVDASLDDVEGAEAHSGIRAARVLLLSLLEAYCLQQEKSALQIAQNPFSQVNPQNAVKFVLASEKFILDYFSRKQEESAALLSARAANRQSELDAIKNGIIKELKRNMRKLK